MGDSESLLENPVRTVAQEDHRDGFLIVPPAHPLGTAEIRHIHLHPGRFAILKAESLLHECGDFLVADFLASFAKNRFDLLSRHADLQSLEVRLIQLAAAASESVANEQEEQGSLNASTDLHTNVPRELKHALRFGES